MTGIVSGRASSPCKSSHTRSGILTVFFSRVSLFCNFTADIKFWNCNAVLFLSISESGKWHGPHLLLWSDDLLLLLHLPLLLEGALLVAHLVLGQVVGPDEPSAANRAAELLLSGVGPAVSGQFVRPGKAATAAVHLAFVRALTWNKLQD